MIRKLLVLAAILLVMLLPGCSKKEAGSAEQQAAEGAKFTVRISTVQMPQQQMGKGIVYLEKELKSRFGDRVDVRLFPSAQLYTGAEEIEALGRGEIDICQIVGGTAEIISTKLALMKLPFLFPSEQAAYDFYETDGGREMLQPIVDRGLMYAGVFSSGKPVFADNKRPLKMPADLVGLKMRAPGKMDTMSAEALGSVAIVTPSEETYAAIQQGVIDGMVTPNSVFVDRKYYEIQKHVTDSGLFSFACGYILVNQKFFDGLSAGDQQLMRDALKATELIMRDEMAQLNVQLEQVMKDNGCEVYVLNDAERDAWIKATSAVYPEMEQTIGVDLVRAAQAHAAKY